MTPAFFETYVAGLIESYAADHVTAGNWNADEAVEKAGEQIHALLPDGVETGGHSLFVIDATSEDSTLNTSIAERVGVLWVAVQERGGKESLWVYDVEIDEPFRQRGYGSAAFVALEEIAKELGMQEISLHVFGGNAAARAMYSKLGFGEVDVVMSKSMTR